MLENVEFICLSSQTKEMMQKHLERKSKEGEEMRLVFLCLPVKRHFRNVFALKYAERQFKDPGFCKNVLFSEQILPKQNFVLSA